MIGDEIANNESSEDESCDDSDVMVEFEDEVITPNTTKKVLSEVKSTEEENLSEEEENSSAEEENSSAEEESSSEEEEEESSSNNQNLKVCKFLFLVFKTLICLNLINENKILYTHYF